MNPAADPQALPSRMSVEAYRAMVRRAGRRDRREAPEEALQRACVQWAALQSRRYPILEALIHVPNGGRRPKGEAGKLKAMGVRPGVPDFLLPLPSPAKCWSGLAIELKAKDGRLSRAQAEWLERLADAGWRVAVVRSLEEFCALITEYAHPTGD